MSLLINDLISGVVFATGVRWRWAGMPVRLTDLAMNCFRFYLGVCTGAGSSGFAAYCKFGEK